MTKLEEKKGNKKTVLVTGATGYVGSRLIGYLIENGYHVRAMSRSIEKLKSRSWSDHQNVDLCCVDVFNLEDLKQATEGCFAVYYLVHSMYSISQHYAEADRKAAENMRLAAEAVGVSQMIYLGGLGEDHEQLSTHLKSRIEVAKILSEGKVSVTVLRAAMIIGSGSVSFEILRYLVERLPIMITPKWLETPNQPIAIRNVLNYLVGVLGSDEALGRTFDIGGSQILTYQELMRIYAEVAGLPKRWIIPVPVLTPRLSSYWIHLVTPVPASIARPLAEGLKYPVICRENEIKKIVSQDLLDCRKAIELALQCYTIDQVVSHWTDAGAMSPIEVTMEGDPEWAGGTILKDFRQKEVNANADEVWFFITRIGGETGWYHANFLWIIRGVLDRWFGGVGLRRGRRHRVEILPGDALDFWRVLQVVVDKKLSLSAEMKLPGKAMLKFEIEAVEGKTILKQTAVFHPKGLWGLIYWYSIYLLHNYIFQGMLDDIAGRAEALHLARKKKKEVVE